MTNRRGFLGRLVGVIAGLLGMGRAAKVSEQLQVLRKVMRYDRQAKCWERVRMVQLRKGDLFALEAYEEIFVATNDGQDYGPPTWGYIETRSATPLDLPLEGIVYPFPQYGAGLDWDRFKEDWKNVKPGDFVRLNPKARV